MPGKVYRTAIYCRLSHVNPVVLNQVVEPQKDEDRFVLVVDDQLPVLTQLLGIDRVGIEVVVDGEGDAGGDHQRDEKAVTAR